MAKNLKPAGAAIPQGEAREGVVASVEKRQTKAGAPMLVLTIGEERVSFFDAEDVARPIAIGDTVTFNLTRKGTYLNGKGLAIAGAPPPAPVPGPVPPPGKPDGQPIPVPSPTAKPAPAKKPSGARPALHDLTETQLLDLYKEEIAAAKVEPARLGQISNQVRYARIEQSLAELTGLLREVLALLQKSYLRDK